MIAFVLMFLAADVQPPQVGEVYDVKGSVFAAKSLLHVEELGKAMLAKDSEGVVDMVEKGSAMFFGPRAGGAWVLRVLEVKNADAFNRYPYVECRLLRDGKVVGTVFVFQVYFKDRTVIRKEGG